MKELKVFDNPQNVKRLLFGFYVFLVVLLVIDIVLSLLIHRHADFAWEEVPNFFAAYGFISCVLLIFIAKALRLFVKRDEDYYD